MADQLHELLRCDVMRNAHLNDPAYMGAQQPYWPTGHAAPHPAHHMKAMLRTAFRHWLAAAEIEGAGYVSQQA